MREHPPLPSELSALNLEAQLRIWDCVPASELTWLADGCYSITGRGMVAMFEAAKRECPALRAEFDEAIGQLLAATRTFHQAEVSQ